MAITNDAAAIAKFRSIIGATGIEVLSLADVELPEPTQEGRDARQSAAIRAAIISDRTGLATVACVRTFTIDPLFSYNPDPQLSHASSYPSWTWRVPPLERTDDFVGAVRSADRTLWQGGYCGPDDRGAYFLTTLCFMTPKGNPHFFEASCVGQFFLSKDAISEHGVDFTKCLTPTGHAQPLDELDSNERASLSDLRKAILALAEWLSTSR